MVIVEAGANYRFVGEQAEIESYTRGIASLALAAYGHEKFADIETALDELVIGLSDAWGIAEGQDTLYSDICENWSDLKERRLATLIGKAREGVISPAHIHAEATDINTTEEVFFVSEDGLSYGNPKNDAAVLETKEVETFDVHDALDEDRIPDGLYVTSAAIQHELVEDDGTYRLLSDRQHTSIGVGSGPTYKPLATVLDSRHEVMRLQQETEATTS